MGIESRKVIRSATTLLQEYRFATPQLSCEIVSREKRLQRDAPHRHPVRTGAGTARAFHCALLGAARCRPGRRNATAADLGKKAGGGASGAFPGSCQRRRLFIHHPVRLRGADSGLRRDHVLLVSVSRVSGYSSERLVGGYRELLACLEGIPGVRTATLGIMPISLQGGGRAASVEGYPSTQGERRSISINWVAPKYFATFGIPLLLGRDFTARDDGGPLTGVRHDNGSFRLF
jgi:hypothetical protein